MKFMGTGLFGVIASVPFLLMGSTSPGAADPLTWLSGVTVIGLATSFYKFMKDRISKLETQVDELSRKAELRAEEDRRLLIPLLSRSVEAQAAYLSRRLEGEQTGER